ncbi:MT-A70 family methyltransferase [Hoeflea sp. YIM 152468]|uniref:Spo0J and IME4 domain-containing protein n=1 Tax=Hoeflea sp. YIM 152468 TaxID=3031759 RepID=UPI0023DCD3DD|nr:MT-A70 family methyltransferase [Hoeflea sp. YIM 152468]MDF1606973.1 MT-A70 family methyltransferase [Hoeflea sp. YIM 152468]
MSEFPFLPLHPLCTLFPAMDGETFAAFLQDIADNGLREPIVTLDGQVLDGRNRQAACAELGLVPDGMVTEYDGVDALAFVLSKNLARRHLSESQRAAIAAQLVNWEKGVNQHTSGPANLQTRQAARALSISERAVAACRSIRKHGAPALFDAIRDGRVTVHTADALKTLPDPDVQRLLKAGDRAVLETAKALRTEKMAASRAGRLSLMAAISAKGLERARPGALPAKAFAVGYADVPWEQANVWDHETGNDRAYPYPTLPLDEIKALCAGDASPFTDDAVLFFWRTGNRQRPALEVVEAWGFEVVTEIMWNKVHRGTGRWVIDCHEVLMICKRGDPPCPLPGTQPLSVYTEPKTEHSAKPHRFREIIDTMFPSLPKLELFGRGVAPDGWTFWGFEAEGEGEGGRTEAAGDNSPAAGRKPDRAPAPVRRPGRSAAVRDGDSVRPRP